MVLRNETGDDGSGHSVVVGLVGDPGLATKLAGRLASELPAVLSQQVSDQVSWTVEVSSEAAPVDPNGDMPLIEYGRVKVPWENWDFMVCLTDLPQRAGTRPVLAEISAAYGVAQVSLPAIGPVRICRNVRDTMVHVLDALTNRASEPERGQTDGREYLTPRPTERVSPVRHIPSTQEGIDSYLCLVGARGRARLLAGMVRTNRPWRLVPALSSAAAAAVAGAAFGIFFSNIWSLADALSAGRLAAINVVAVAAMIFWLIVYNNLWDRRAGRHARRRAVLYNVSTVLTLTVGVACMYLVLFAVILVGALAVISSAYLHQTLGHSVSPTDYASLVWLSCSMGTIAGALGSGLESEDAVRRATYSKRERERQARRREQQQREEQETETQHEGE